MDTELGLVVLADCNDNDSTINPGAVEVIGDNVDQDCNGRDLIMPKTVPMLIKMDMG